ncbi:MAG: sigma-54 dependent transcriptional regulator [Planctomycetota bacterium]
MEAVTSQKQVVSPFRRSGPLPFRSQKSWPRLAGNSQAGRHLEEVISRVATFECPVLITGETGCGKEEVARAIHAASPRRDGPFVSINCGGLVATLAESHFFGHEKGAFTGAVGSALGGFRAANGGVVFLDEIGEMPLELQPKLLQVLQRWEVTPVGSTKSYPVDVQVITATNRDLESRVDKGLFRDDLFYRLNTVHISIPPLRSRAADIPGFIDHFSAHFAQKYGRPQWQPDAGLLERLLAHPWPGNVRQLAQTIQRLYVFEDRRAWVLKQLFQDDAQEDADVAAPIQADSMPAVSPAPLADPMAAEPTLPLYNLAELRRLAVRQALAATKGNRGRAADLLGVSLNTMTRMVVEFCPDLAPKGGRRPAAKPR